MNKYSIIVPVYNVEKYLERCLDSLVKQTYDDYEIIIVNDGSTDSSGKIISKYKKKYPKKIKVYAKENSGNVAIPRNFALDKITGDYILFVDSDDYISLDTLAIIEKSNDINYDIIFFSGEVVDYDESLLSSFSSITFSDLSGEEALKSLIKNVNCFEMVWRYAYSTRYFLDNCFEYSRYHEDFGLTPTIVARAKTVRAIDDKLYFYRQSDNSIIRNSNYGKTKEKAYDVLCHFDVLYKEFNGGNYSTELKILLNSYIANAVIPKLRYLNRNDKKEYIKELNKRKVTSLLLRDTVPRKIKKLLLSININLYRLFY